MVSDRALAGTRPCNYNKSYISYYRNVLSSWVIVSFGIQILHSRAIDEENEDGKE